MVVNNRKSTRGLWGIYDGIYDRNVSYVLKKDVTSVSPKVPEGGKKVISSP